MKKIIVPAFFLLLIGVGILLSMTIVNYRLDGRFTYEEEEYDLTDKEIYEQVPQFVTYDRVYRKYKVSRQYTKGRLTPNVITDTVWDTQIYAKNEE